MSFPKNKKVNYSDLKIIAQLFSGDSSLFIFDPHSRVKYDTNVRSESCSKNNKVLFNFGGELIRFKQFNLNEFTHIIDFSSMVSVENFKKLKLNLIQSTTGVGRYIFRQNEGKFCFLDFYQSSTLRSKLIKFFIKILVRSNSIKLIGLHFNVLYKDNIHFKQIVDPNNRRDFSISLGAPGFWRKPVIQLIKGKIVSHYVKFSITPQTEALIQREGENLRQIESYRFKGVKTPNLLQHNSKLLFLEVFKETKGDRITSMNKNLFNVLNEFAERTMKYKKLKSTSFYSEIMDYMTFLKENQKNLDNRLYYNLCSLYNVLKRKQYISTSLAHGDFTPWNFFQKKSTTYLYDWEMMMTDAPLFYDLFHFIYQSEILSKRNKIEDVEHEISNFFRQDYMKEYINRYNIDIEFHHNLYLLHVISKNQAIISQQATISEDQKLLIYNWKLVLLKLQIPSIEKKPRKVFLGDFQTFLLNKEYAALKFYLSDFQDLPITSDLDLAIKKDDLKSIELFISNHAHINHVDTIKKTFMTTLKIFFTEDAFLSIDLIHDFIRKGQRYLKTDALLNQTIVENGVRRPNILDDIQYAQHFYTLNFSHIPLNYQSTFSQKLKLENKTETYISSFNRRYQTTFNGIDQTFQYSNEKRKSITKYNKRKFKQSFYKLGLRYLKDIWIDISQNKGFIVTFSGVDGAGKTTIIDLVKSQLENKYRKDVILLRHRPGLLPILSAIKYGGSKNAEEEASKRLPRQGLNKSKLSSLLRFAYYYIDYLLGQVYIKYKYLIRGKVVIYDRYYYDFINDSKRSNIKLKRSFIKALFKFIHKPSYNFYLFNDPEVILKRKKELTSGDIIDLNKKYHELFNEFNLSQKGNFIQIKNDKKSITLSEIFNTINKVA